ncbi:MAG: amidase family protein [Halioglobus sp.]|nr:amidase family protein [Halioglobus sp.]
MSTSKALRYLAAISLAFTLLACSDNSDNPGEQPSPPGPFSTASEMVSAIQTGDITSSELLEIHLERIEDLNPSINAVVSTDIDAARARAAEADAAVQQGELWGPLHGLPVTIKDTMNVSGLPTVIGNPDFADFVPDTNAAGVQRLLDAGAIVIGKTNTPLFAGDWQTYNDVFGTTNNPWDLSRTPGGSSGGSVAAIVSGMSALELGGDLAGSLRVPAHFTGVYSHMPSLGLIPMDGHFSRFALPPAPEPPGAIAGVIGPLARSAEDLELAMSVLAADAFDSLPPARGSELSDFRVAAWLTDPALTTDMEVLDVLESAVAELENAGIEVDRVTPVDDLRRLVTEYLQLRLHITNRISLAPEALDALLARRATIIADVENFFENYDVLLMPAAPTVAFPHDQSPLGERTLSINGESVDYVGNIDFWIALAQYANLPVTTAPLGLGVSGLPVGIQVIGPAGEDLTTLTFAGLLGEATGGFEQPPLD